LALGGSTTFGHMIGEVVRCVAENVEAAIIPDCRHCITEEQPQATTELVVDFLRRAMTEPVVDRTRRETATVR